MSYPPTSRDGRPISPPGQSRSSADMYSSVPVHDSAYEDYSPNPDNSYPERVAPSRSMGSFGLDNDPYARYGEEGGASGLGSTANLSEVDGQSQMGLHAKGRSASGLGGYGDKEEEHSPPGSTRLRRGAATGGAGGGFWSRLSSRAKKFVILGAILALLIIIIAVAVPAAIVTKNNNKNKAEDAGTGGSSRSSSRTIVESAPSGVPTGGSNTDWRTAAVGGDGSTVYMEDGTSFIYNNSFGGFWNAIPFNDTAKCQADMPALNETWDYSKNLISGVNLGGWLVTEPFIVPGLYEPFNPNGGELNFNATVVDEWTLCEALGDNMTNVMTEHYETFITEKDFAEIAAAGLNWVRIPIGWWLIETWEGEPFLANVGWTYFLKAITWARKYGLRINLDLHSIPGSQNGYNHSGKLGSINFLNGIMGIANAQRTLSYIRTLAEFISQDEYKNVIPMFSILNEPYAATIEVDTLRHFYYETYNMIRDITGIGEGKGPFITFHDGFTGTPVRNVTEGGWLGWMPGMDRVALDTHPYLCFSEPNNDGITYQAAKPCSYWAESMNTTAQEFGYYMAGEWSLAFNDCGRWLNNVGNGQRYEGTYYIPGNTTTPAFERLGDCEPWTNYPAYNQSTIDGLKLVASGHMDAFRSWFFWTWKTGYSEQLGMIANPVWNYQLGLQQGWIPENPRTIVGICTSLISENGFTVAMSENPAPTLSAWMTGGAGAGTMLDEAQVTSFSAWPPTALQGTTTEFFPTYTPTGDALTMPTPTVTSYPSGYSSSANVGDGWFNPSDTAGQMTPVAGCTYPDAWSGAGQAVPTSVCTGSADARMKMKRSPSPSPTTPSSVYATITAQPRPTARRQ